MKALRVFTCCAAAITALALTSSQAAADFATPFVETTPVGGTSKEYGYLVSLGPQGTRFLVIVMTDQRESRVLRGVADEGVVKDSVLGKRAVIQARVLKKQRDEKSGRVDVELKITRVWPDAEATERGTSDAPPEVETGKQAAVAWGESVEGVQVRAKLKDATPGHSPVLLVDVRNVGDAPRWAGPRMGKVRVASWSLEWPYRGHLPVSSHTFPFNSRNEQKGRLLKPGESVTAEIVLDERWTREERPAWSVGGMPKHLPLRWSDGCYAIQYFVRVLRPDSHGKPIPVDQAGAIDAVAASKPIEYVYKGR